MKAKYTLKNKRRFYTFMTTVLLITMITAYGTIVHGYKEPTLETVTVRSGDTLWSIALQYGGDVDTRKAVYDLKKRNNLQSDDIYIGEQILVPIRY